ncbi:pseudouridylate synthase RPUSD4, mitochondrial-like [Hylaeus anthracinus]|uniref:pseudouridylate synthase RPUSD4, mitochondrial-like n=1 Tax=Hylaeus anthracinus TaxID=313031 RepID=UPI0023B9F6E2|nr:pseudouridylate synthase RPUSD4, mitochondrial-like [Hylaeus anthracinus]
MKNVIFKFGVFTRMCTSTINTLHTKLLKRNYMESVHEKPKIHPYKQIHPWKSLQEFADYIATNVIYNENGLVALNKPYGISHRKTEVKTVRHFIPNAVDYTLEDALPYIAKRLNYSKLTLIRKPEKYMTGLMLLTENTHVQNNVELALRRGNNFTKTYWVTTIRVPNVLRGKEHLAMKLQSNPNYRLKKPIIVTSWTKNDEKRNAVKILNVEFNVLSNSTFNLCSLIEIKSSTIQWHALRLFASTYLYSPILGDNLYASRIQKLGNAYINIDPHLEYTELPPKLNRSILQVLNVKPSDQHIIPCHIHLRSMVLPSFLDGKQDLMLKAPLIPPFNWTCKQLEFKYLMQDT